MRMYNVLFLSNFILGLPSTCYACENAGEAKECSLQNGCDGKFYTGQYTNWQPCESDHYCPGDGIAYCCPEPFTTTKSVGATGVSECYIKIDKDIDNNSIETPIYVACPADKWLMNINTNNFFCDISNCDKYMVQRNPNESAYDKLAYDLAKCLMDGEFINSTTPIQETAPNGYHFEEKPLYSQYTSGQPWISDSFEIVLVSNEMPCNTFRKFPENNTPDGYIDAVNAPLETTTFTGNSDQTQGTNCPSNAQILGNATWIENSDSHGYWNISQCRCQITNQEISDAKCYGSSFRSADTNYTVHTIYENIIFTNTSTNTTCQRCLRDDSNHKYYVPDYGFSGGVVTACTDSPAQKGRYRDGSYGGCNIDSEWGNLQGNPCSYKKCPAGKTSEGLPIGVDGCTYSPQTKFCDAKGCFTLTEGQLVEWGLKPNP